MVCASSVISGPQISLITEAWQNIMVRNSCCPYPEISSTYLFHEQWEAQLTLWRILDFLKIAQRQDSHRAPGIRCVAEGKGLPISCILISIVSRQREVCQYRPNQTHLFIAPGQKAPSFSDVPRCRIVSLESEVCDVNLRNIYDPPPDGGQQPYCGGTSDQD